MCFIEYISIKIGYAIPFLIKKKTTCKCHYIYVSNFCNGEKLNILVMSSIQYFGYIRAVENLIAFNHSESKSRHSLVFEMWPDFVRDGIMMEDVRQNNGFIPYFKNGNGRNKRSFLHLHVKR